MTFCQLFEILYSRYQKLFLDVEELSHELNITAKTARNWLTSKCFPIPTEKIRGRRLATLSALCQYYIDVSLPPNKSESPPESCKTLNEVPRKRGRPQKFSAGEVEK